MGSRPILPAKDTVTIEIMSKLLTGRISVSLRLDKV